MSILLPAHCFIFRGNELLVPSGCENQHIFEGVPADTVRKIFNPAEIRCFEVPLIDKSDVIPCFSLDKNTPAPSGWRNIAVRSLAAEGAADKMTYVYGGLEHPAMPVIFRACHIMQWLSDSVFCGRCGGKNELSNTDLARRCPVCGRVEYPRVSPAIIVRISNGNGEILLAHDKKFSENIYSLIAGFYEAGESLEDTVKRETFEEVGIRIKNIRFISSQSWPFPNSLMIGFSAEHAGGSIHCDGVEIEDARWFSKDKLPLLPGYGSIARFLREQWRQSASIC
jgi:NAD+ diphosphatase